MISHAAFIFKCVLGWLLLCAAACSEELTEEYIASTTAKDGGHLALVKKIKSMPEAERARAGSRSASGAWPERPGPKGQERK